MLIRPLAASLGLVSTVICFSLIQNNDLAFLGLLPLTYAIAVLLFPLPLHLAKMRLGIAVFMAVALARYVIVPALVAVAGYASIPLIRQPAGDAISTAVVIMAAEIVLSFMVIQMLAPKLYSTRQARLPSLTAPPRTLGLALVCLVAGFLIFVNPEVLSRYSVFFNERLWQTRNEELSLSGGVLVITDMLLVLPPLIFLFSMQRRYLNTGRSRFVVFALLGLLPFLLIVKGVSRFSVLVPAIAWMILCIKLFPAHRRKILSTLGVTSLIVVLIVTFQKNLASTSLMGVSARGLDLGYMAWLGNAYFSGPFNMAYAVELVPVVAGHGAHKVLFNDIFANLAVLSALSDAGNTSVSFYNAYLYGPGAQTDQIIPLTGQSFLYFGPLLSPLLLMLTVALLLLMDSRMAKESRGDMAFFYGLATVHLALCMMLSMNSVYPVFFNALLPLYFVLQFNRRVFTPLLSRLAYSK